MMMMMMMLMCEHEIYILLHRECECGWNVVFFLGSGVAPEQVWILSVLIHLQLSRLLMQQRY